MTTVKIYILSSYDDGIMGGFTSQDAAKNWLKDFLKQQGVPEEEIPSYEDDFYVSETGVYDL